MSYTMCSRCNEKPAAICISCLTDCTEQPTAGFVLTKELRNLAECVLYDLVPDDKKLLYEACKLIANLQKERDDLLAALKKVQKILQTKSEIHRPEPLVKPTWVCLKEADYTELEIILIAAIEKATKG